MKKNTTLLLFSFLFIKGLLFVILIPPWQGPDEPSHFEYIEKYLNNLKKDGGSKKTREIIDDSLKKDYLNLRERTNTGLSIVAYKIQRDIVRSMFNFDFWRLTEKPPRYSELDDVEVFFHTNYISSIPYGSEPLSFFITSKVIGTFGITSISNRQYYARIFSMLLGMLTLFFIYRTAKEIVIDPKDNYFAITATAFAGLLPQFSFLSSTVSSGNMANLICSMTIYLLILFIKGDKKTFSGLFRYSSFYFQFISIMLLIIAGLFTKRSTLILIPVVVCSLFLYDSSGGTLWSRLFKQVRLALLFFLAVALAISIINIGYKPLITNLLTRISPAYFSSVSFLNSFSQVAPEAYFRTFSIIFVSFWFSFGWMVYKMSIGWYILFGITTLLSLTGLGRLLYLKIRKNGDFISEINGKGLIVLILLYLFSLFAIIVFRGPTYEAGTSTQGRFIFIALPSITILFLLGIKYICPNSFKVHATKSIFLFMIFLNSISIIKYLIPLFYLN